MHKIEELQNLSKICKTCNLVKIEIALADKKRSKIRDKNFVTRVRTLENYTLNLKYLKLLFLFLLANFYKNFIC